MLEQWVLKHAVVGNVKLVSKELSVEFTVYGKPACSGCEQAKSLLKSKGLNFEYINVMQAPSAQQLFREKGFRSVPQIYQGTEYIGGFLELQKALID